MSQAERRDRTRFLVLGGGAQGSAAAYDLVRDPTVESVLLADRTEAVVRPLLRPFLGGKLAFTELDASRTQDTRVLMAGRDAVLCALPYHLNHEMARIAVEVGIHFADLGGNAEIVERQRALDGAARERGISVIPDCGLAPGMVNILAQAGIEALDEPESVRMWVGGLPQHPRPPLNYQVVYSMEGVLDYYTTSGTILKDGERVTVAPLTGIEALELPPPIGTLEGFFTAGGASNLPRRYEGRLRSIEYRTLRYPGHARLMKAFGELGFFSEEAVEVDGSRVVPRRLFIELVSEKSREGDGRDFVVLRVEVWGRRGGRSTGIRYELLDHYDEDSGMTAMMRCTGFSLAAIASMQARGEVREKGVRTGDEAVDPERFIAEVVGRGIAIRRTELDGDPEGGRRAPDPGSG